MGFTESRRDRKNISIEEVVAEFPLGIVSPTQFNKIGQFVVTGMKLLWTYCEQLPPVRTYVERREFSFDGRQQLAYRDPILFPCEVNGHAWFLITGTHPQIIGGDAADF